MQGGCVEDELKEDFANHIKKFRLSFRDSRDPWKIVTESADIIRVAF